MFKSYKYRIYPNKSQSEFIDKHIGCSRFVYNLALETKQSAYAGNKINLTCFDLTSQLIDLKDQCTWLKEVNSQSLYQSIFNLDAAYTNFFKGSADFPKFKNKHRSKKTFQIPQFTKINFENNKIYFPKFKSGIKIEISRKFEGQMKTVTVSKTPTGKYFASILVDNKKELPKKVKITEKTTVGIDLGIKSFLVTSKGLEIQNPKFLRNFESHLKYLQKQLSKKKKGSLAYNKAKLKFAIYHEYIANSRKDFLQKLSTELIRDNQSIALEDLNVSGMVKNHNLAKSINDCGWRMFVSMLEYKANWSGKNILKIGRFDPSSKTCSECGWSNKDLKLEDREWICKSCNTKHDRDHNAAKNIKQFALRNHLKLNLERIHKNLVELPTMVGVMKQGVSVV